MPAQNTTQQGTRSPGWYSDPLDASRIRFWNGQAWTNDTAARVELPPPTGLPHPAPTTPGPGTPPVNGTSPVELGHYPAPTHSYSPNVNHPTEQSTAHGKAGKPGKAGRRKSRSSGSVGLRVNMFTSAAVVLGILAIIFMPLYVGVLAISCGALAFVRGERRASTGLKIAILGMVIGLVWAYVSARFGMPF